LGMVIKRTKEKDPFQIVEIFEAFSRSSHEFQSETENVVENPV